MRQMMHYSRRDREGMYATLSDDGLYRYRLGRRWGDGGPLLFIMLNPSTADGLADDPTIRRCRGFAVAHEFGALEVVNLFAFRATKPSDLKAAGYPVGPETDEQMAYAIRDAAAVCLAWGANAVGPQAEARIAVVRGLLARFRRDALALAVTKDGHPAHPLMLPAWQRLVPFQFS